MAFSDPDYKWLMQIGGAPADQTLGGLIPPGNRDARDYVGRLEAVARTGRVLPDQLKVLQGRIEAIHKALALKEIKQDGGS